MCQLSALELTRDEVLLKANEFFKGKKEFVTLVDRSMSPEPGIAKWATNIETLLAEF